MYIEVLYMFSKLFSFEKPCMECSSYATNFPEQHSYGAASQKNAINCIYYYMI